MKLGAISAASCISIGSPFMRAAEAAPATTTPIQHLVVIFQENVSFDHYFATYPTATNPAGEPQFTAKAGTLQVNGLLPNSVNGMINYLVNNPNGANPQRLDNTPSQALTCDQDHAYKDEETAADGGKMDKFLSSVATATGNSPTGQPCQASTNLDYYDGNTVTALWNYAQNFAMSDNSFGTTYGPSTPGALEVASGMTDGVGFVNSQTGTANTAVEADGLGGMADIGDSDPYYDDCSSKTSNISMTGTNVGDELNSAGLSWGFFEGGFSPTVTYSGPATTPGTYNPANVSGGAVCGSSHPIGAAMGGTGQWGTESDYIPHHQPFQYYASTANPHHLAPASLSVIGTDTQSFTASGQPQFNTANHQYDMSDFNNLVASISAGNLSPSHLPAVSYLKAPAYEDGHAGDSDPVDEQRFVTEEINALEQTPDWSSTAVVVAYDDSDGFYDHVYSGAQNNGQPQLTSQSPADTLTGTGQCGTAPAKLNGSEGRCGYGPRLPLLVISPWAKTNSVDHTLTDQSSIVKFIQNNWSLPPIAGSAATVAGTLNNMFNFSGSGNTPTLFLDPTTGEPLPAAPCSKELHTCNS
ncbi:MAG: phospholipase C [Acidimicrobiales bacterium]